MPDKVFKCFQNFLDAIDNAQYTNNDPVQYNALNIPEVHISDWENIKALDKTAITTAAAADGFEVIP